MAESSIPKLDVREGIPLAPYTTFQVGGPARYFIEITRTAQLPDAVAWARERGLPIFVLGGGSNLLVPDDGFEGVVLHMNTRGIERQQPSTFFVQAGEPWESLVSHVVDRNCAGMECLAGIPGSTGGTPVQNVGAYGQEVSQTIREVHVFDTKAMEDRVLANSDCGFQYRQSVFNTSERGRYVVTGVVFTLTPDGEPNLRYGDLQKRFADQPRPTLRQVADAVREIRKSKGMLLAAGDPDCRSAGSFFKNPVVQSNQLPAIARASGVAADSVPRFAAGPDKVKVPAAWLLERAGYVKGYGSGPVRISSKHTLALTNRGGACFDDILALEHEIVAGVRERFGITLHREPVVLARSLTANAVELNR